MKRQSLTINLESLFPGSTLEIGNESIIIRPLTIEQLAILSKKVSGLGKILSEKNITWENYSSTENLIQIAVVLLQNVPDVLEEAANVDIASLNALPLEIIVQIIDKIISENLKSKESLEKNFKSLTEKFLPVEENLTQEKEQI